MKELKDRTQIYISRVEQATKKYFSKRNYWKLAQHQKVSGITKRQNYMTEHYFKMVIVEVKQLCIAQQLTVFERDYRACSDEFGCSMHTFASPTFYFHLECSATMDYWFKYDFNDFLFEATIVARIEHLFYMNEQSKRVTLLPETFEYFSLELIREEDKGFLYTL
jgi:hypothetical protein